MSVAAPQIRMDFAVRLQLDKGSAEMLERVARAKFEGNKSAAVRHLIAVHAGLTAEQVDEDLEAIAREVLVYARRPLSRDLAGEVAGIIRGGAARVDAYHLAGVTLEQGREWEKRGRADQKEGRRSVYADFLLAIHQAEAELKVELAGEARRKGDYKFVLSRLFPDQFAETRRTDSTTTHRTLPMIDLERLTVEEARVFLALARKASPGSEDAGISARARPIGELLPADVDGEAHEV